MPFPIVAEVFLVELLSEGVWAGASRFKGAGRPLVIIVGTFLGAMIAMQAGVVGPMPAVVGILSLAAIQALPNPVLSRTVRVWRFVFTLGAVGLGMYGLSLLGFVMMVYLGEERPFGHPLRLTPAGGMR